MIFFVAILSFALINGEPQTLVEKLTDYLKETTTSAPMSTTQCPNQQTLARLQALLAGLGVTVKTTLAPLTTSTTVGVKKTLKEMLIDINNRIAILSGKTTTAVITSKTDTSVAE